MKNVFLIAALAAGVLSSKFEPSNFDTSKALKEKGVSDATLSSAEGVKNNCNKAVSNWHWMMKSISY